MTPPRILVCGAAGKTGRATVDALASRNVRVRAIVRVDDARAKSLRATGAEVVVANLDDYREVRAAFRDVQRAFFVTGFTQAQLDQALHMAIAAADARVEHVVAIGQWLANPAHPSVATRRTWLVDQILDWIPGATHTVINVGWFADNFMPMLGMAAQLGLFPFPLGEGRAAPVSNEDIGAVAAAALVDPLPGAVLRPTGPLELSPVEIADAFQEVVGRKVRYVDLPVPMFAKALRALRLVSPLLQAQLPSYVQEYQRGAFEGVTDVVPRLTGRSAEPFGAIVARYAERDPMARRSLGNTLRAMGQFLRIAVTPALSIPRWNRAQSIPMLRAPVSSVDSSDWRATHRALA
ncbi:MAG: NmrA family NAD(P)-binding protein [Myxococcota bacterium]